MATDEGNLDDISVRDVKQLFIKFAFVHGPWFVLACVMLAAQMGWLSSPQSRDIGTLRAELAATEIRLTSALHENRKVILENRQTMVEMQYGFENKIGYQNVLLRVICRNQVTLQQQGLCEPKYYGYEERIVK